MGALNNVLTRLAERYLAKQVQGDNPSQRYRDYLRKGESYSIESEICEALADLMLMFSTAPIEGDSERAKWLDKCSLDFFADSAKLAVSSSFLTGDCIVVPSWNGRNIQNIVVPSQDFVVTGAYGKEITSCAYVLDRKEFHGETYQLMQAIELVPYTTGAGLTYANRYRLFVSRNDSLEGGSIEDFSDWKDRWDREWYIPNVDRLLIGRMRSHAIDPRNPNSIKGIPICFGAGAPIKEIHYLLNQMHSEFDLSEKFIMADKRLFQKEFSGTTAITVLPKGKDRVIMATGGMGEPSSNINEWSPDIRYQAYLDAIDKQEQLVERAVGVSSGIISRPNDMNYQNVDNVRKSQQKTVGFISTARREAESMLGDLVYAWDVLANYYGITPMGEYEAKFDWSDEYIETFADTQNAILAGSAIGATDAVDYRSFLFNETKEQAAERVAEIQAAQENQAAYLMPLAS